MNSLNLRSVNLNLLPVLHALLRERSLVGASRALSLSQPAVHAALTQLRGLFDDPLLVREGRHMVLSARALELVEPVERATEAMRRVLETPVFDPAQSRRCFVVAGGDYAALLLGRALLMRLTVVAPHASVHFINIAQTVGDQLRRGELDLAIMPDHALDALQWPQVQRTPLWNDQFVRAVRAGHPLAAAQAPSEEDIAYFPQVTLEPVWYPDPNANEEYWGVDLALRQSAEDSPAERRVRVEQFALLPLLASQSDAVAMLPQQILAATQPMLPLIQVGPPCPTYGMAMAWSLAKTADPGQAWLRTLILEVAAHIQPLQEPLNPPPHAAVP